MTEWTADSFEVSPQQERLWLAEPAGPSGRIQVHVLLEGRVDATRLRDALTRTTGRHEILRTTFVQNPGMRVPHQAVQASLDPAWTSVDGRGHEQEDWLEELAGRELIEPLDFESGPLVRAVLARHDEERHVLVLTVSSLCADESTIGVIVREMVRLYGGSDGLVEDPLQYADFSAWQRELEASDDDDSGRARDFWSRAQDTVDVQVPFVRQVAASPASESSDAAPAPGRCPVEIEPGQASRLLEEALRYGASPATVAHAAWHAVLRASTGEGQVTVALLGAERRHDDLEGAVGAFSRPVPIQSQVGPETTFAELLQQVASAEHEARVWQDYAPVGTDVCAVGFVSSRTARRTAGELTTTVERLVVTGLAQRVWVTCIADENQLALEVHYDPRFLAPETAERLARRLGRLLESAAADAGTAVTRLEVLDQTERDQLLTEWGAGAAPHVGGSVLELFGAHARERGSRDAVVDEHGALSYAELDARANQLANRLRRAGVGPEITVGLCTDRSVDMVVGLLGILKAGGAYVPLHYDHPPARLAQQLTTAGAQAVVTQESLLAHLPEFSGEVVCLDRDRRELDDEDRTPPEVQVDPDNLVYVIFTSGSTGVPKGVGVTHGNLFNYASDIARRVGADETPMSFGVVTSISTDLGNTSVFGALCSGGTLVLISPAAASDANALARQAATRPIDVLKITPSHISALIAGGDASVLPGRWLLIGGERAPWDLVERVRAMGDCQILNHYGPTEATIGCCTFLVPADLGRAESATVPIGSPIAGTSCYLLDAHGRLVPIGSPGRLHIGGAGVARGYVGAPDLTAERFVSDEYASAPDARMYDTGDIARWLPDGVLEFLGRVDEQIKVRGYRVEPAEVESALRSHPNVGEAVVVAREGGAGALRLIAYCTVNGEVSAAELEAHLAQWLPEFMLPSAVVKLDALPVTPSGKIDRLALPEPDSTAEQGADYVAPQSPVEQTMADMWAEVLGVQRVGSQDDFFALGGHSLLATQVVAQVRSDFAVDLPLHSLFTYPTVASLSAEIVRLMGDSEAEETTRLMSELEGMTDEEAERLLAGESRPPE